MLSEGFIAARPSGDKVPARTVSGCIRQSATQPVGDLCVKLSDNIKSRVLGERRVFGGRASAFSGGRRLAGGASPLVGMRFRTTMNAEQPALGEPLNGNADHPGDLHRLRLTVVLPQYRA